MTSVKSVKGRSTIIGPARQFTDPLLLSAPRYTGAWAFSSGRMAFSDGFQWQQLISSITVLTTKTVGTGGDFATLGDALAYFAGFTPSADNYEFLGKIVILNGTVISDQVRMIGQDLGWVVIESETPYVDVSVNVSTFTLTDIYLTSRMSFLSFISGTAPIINCRFRKTGTAPIDPGTGLPRPVNGMSLRTTSYASLTDPAQLTQPIPPVGHTFKSGFYGFAENLRVGANSSARINAMEFADATEFNVITSTASSLFVWSRARNCLGSYNLQMSNSAFGSVFASDAQNVSGVNAVTDVKIDSGSIVSIGGGSLCGVSETEIVPTGSGIVFDDRLALTPTWGGFIKPQSYTVATLPAAASFTGCMIYVSDETGGATVAFSDGTNWRRVQDRNIVS